MKQPPHTFFLAVGSTKTGTSWLYHMLNLQEQVALTPVKEISYFFARQVLGDNLPGMTKFITPHFLRKHFKNVLRRRISAHKKDLKKGKFNYQRFDWEVRFFFFKQTDAWYVNLFDYTKVTGDISPMYSFLNEESVQHISKILPHAKIILGMRDPVEKMWSHIKMLYLNPEVSDLHELKKYINDPLQIKASEYDRIHRMWSTYFNEDQIFTYFFDELAEDSKGLFNRICEFLEIEANSEQTVSSIINRGKKAEMPREIRNSLNEIMLPIVHNMIPYFKEAYPKRWYEKYVQEMKEETLD